MMTTTSKLDIVTAEDLFDMREAFGSSSIAERQFARGYNTEGDVLTQTVDGRDLNEVWREFQQALAAWNAGRTALINALTFEVTNPVEDVPQLVVDDFEEASEFGEPKSIRGEGFFQMGYDFKWYDVAVRYTWKYLAEASAAQVENRFNQVMEADNRLMFNGIMRAIFNNVNRTATIRGNNFNVYALYNGDGTVPPPYGPNTFSGSESHYMTSGAGTVDAGDLVDMDTKLALKGYGVSNGARQILLVNRAQTATIRNFRVATGAAYDFIPVNGGAPWLLPTNTGGVVSPQGSTNTSDWNGLPVIGVFGPWAIIENDYIPAGYMLGISSGGAQSVNNVVGLREHQNPGLRGLRLIKGRDSDYPLVDSFYGRGFGTGIRHRGAAVVMQITASGTYTIPAAWA